jgi:sodium transport system permease protein
LLPVENIDVSLDIPPGALLRLFVLILPIILLGATVLTALAAFARSYREAQGYLPLLIFLPMVPSLLLMVAPVRTQPWMLAVPFMGQFQLILRPLRGEAIAGWEWALSLGSGFALAALAWFIAARLYHRERLAISG